MTRVFAFTLNPILTIYREVPLEAFTIEAVAVCSSETEWAWSRQDGQMLLERQRVFPTRIQLVHANSIQKLHRFNDGLIDPRYQWLQDMVSATRSC